MTSLDRAFLAFLILCAAVTPFPAHAYIDPGAGSAFIQLVIALCVAGAAGIRIFWARILALFGKGKGKKD